MAIVVYNSFEGWEIADQIGGVVTHPAGMIARYAPASPLYGGQLNLKLSNPPSVLEEFKPNSAAFRFRINAAATPSSNAGMTLGPTEDTTVPPYYGQGGDVNVSSLAHNVIHTISWANGEDLGSLGAIYDYQVYYSNLGESIVQTIDFLDFTLDVPGALPRFWRDLRGAEEKFTAQYNLIGTEEET